MLSKFGQSIAAINRRPARLLLLPRRSSFCRAPFSSNFSSGNSSASPESSSPSPPSPDAIPDDTSGHAKGHNPQSRPTLFPWRHDRIPLPRLIDGTIEQVTQGQLLTSTEMTPGNSTMNLIATAYMFLNVPWYQFFFLGSWKAELADSVSYALTQTLGNVLSQVSGVSEEEIIKDDYQLDFHQTIQITGEISDNNIAASNDDDGTNHKESSTMSQEATKIIQLNKDELSKMIDDKMITLYQSALDQATPGEYEVRLQTLPYSAELVCLYTIPYISRSNIQHNRSLQEEYRSMLNKPSTERAPYLNQLRQEYLEGGKMESTVIAQVLIWCQELFWVKDKVSGNVILGEESEEPRNIPHLVRCEMTVKTKKNDNGQFTNQTGNWIVTDIDDLLEGNLIV